MLQALWFFLQIASVVIPATWLVLQPGSVAVQMMGYTFTIQAGVFFIILVALLLVALFIYRVIKSILSVPQTVAKYKEEDKRKRGYRALTRGFVSLAAGDVHKASKYSAQLGQLWPGQNGLPVLLEAQTARLRGEDGLAQNRFEELLKDKDASFLGVRGLLKSALDEGQIRQALDFARQAQKLHPKQNWVLRTVYELELRNHLWTDVLETSPKAVKFGAITKERAMRDRIAIYLMRYDYDAAQGEEKRSRKQLEKAYKLDSNFIPTVTRFVQFHIKNKKRRKAASLIKKAWRDNPHPELAKLWDDLAPKDDSKNLVKRSKWIQNLIALNPDHFESQLAAAKASMDMKLWGEAKTYLIAAERIYPSSRVFRLQAVVEKNSAHNEEAMHRLMDKSAEALPDKIWVCQQTGMTYDQWYAVAMPHESFNTISWDYPTMRAVGHDDVLLNDTSTALLIDPAQ